MPTNTDTPKRYAIIRGAKNALTLRAYLPDNYVILYDYTIKSSSGRDDLQRFVIEGHDVAGWTLDGYVLPRLASGLIFGGEVDAETAERAPREGIVHA